MEWDRNGGGLGDEERRKMVLEALGGGGGGGAVMAEDVMCGVKVMTDEQMEVLRKQISIYATICEQLVEMHKAITASQDSLSGTRMGSLYCDSLMSPGGHKLTARQRWNPTPMQLQILESIFDQGNGTPNKQKIKEITSELSQHGQISETNVYNWFQNRRARSKRKQSTSLPNNESETETEVESLQEKKAKSERIQALGSSLPIAGGISSNTEISFSNPELNKPQGISSGSSDQISFYDNVLSNPRIDQMMEMPNSFNFSHSGEGYDMIG